MKAGTEQRDLGSEESNLKSYLEDEDSRSQFKE